MDPFFCLPIIIAISILVAALGFMLAGILDNPQFNAKVKEEMRATATGVLLAVVIVGILSSINAFIEVYTGYTDASALSVAYIDGFIERIKTSLIELAIVFTRLGEYGLYYALSLPLFIVLISTGQTPLAGVGSFSSSLGIAQNALIVFLLALYSLKHLLYFAYFITNEYLLGIGIVFRLIPMMRKIGATLIALSLVVLIILPISVAVFGELTNAVPAPNFDKILNRSMSIRLISPIKIFNMNSIPFCTQGTQAWVRLTDEMMDCACNIPPLNVIPYEICELVFDIIYNVAYAFETIAQWSVISTFTIIMDPVERIFNPVVDVFVPAIVEISVLLTTFFVSVILVVISAYRSISLALGGEFFLYGFARFA